ncbi:hypothetical protein Y032_0090g2372 [Ancylostoma ceylanicum]|uniref:Reverse transcriptase domain-containing protein n=1 Tax=Ancylostoma ceylanicum TaxID=53326 RepID=A0A016TMT9_9BILA|nr:hypothetical protein Y032_0090g2372 [Ancylostoma ceylanicum]
MKKMRVGRATGPDCVPVEVWKSLCEPCLNWLTKFVNNIARSARIPKVWRDSIILLIFKSEGDVMDVTNYKGIKLIAHTMEIYERLVDMRLREVVETASDQFGFVPERLSIDAISLPGKLWKSTAKRTSRVKSHF